MNNCIKYAMLPMTLITINAHASYDIGIKSGYQIYSNQLNSPTAVGAGAFISLPIFDSLNIEAGFTFLGEGEEKNKNKGGFYVGEFE
ncbi:hypothetical protein [Vibrio rotiferianus]|uniref:hypothetical protein n=1 Tax=Vibrio rotiferianus TaxID=190895 RepID=UPI00390AF41F